MHTVARSIQRQVQGWKAVPVARMYAGFKSAATDVNSRMKQQVDWQNPKERLPYVPDEVLGALPPRAKPWKWTERETRWTQFRARIPFGVLVLMGCAYAAYLHVNDRGMGRLRLERTSPQVTALLEAMGILRALPQAEGLARGALFLRLFARYAPSGSMSASEAVDVINEASGGGDDGVKFGAGPVSLKEFVVAATAACSGISDKELYLSVLERLGVPALDPVAEAELSALFDFVVEANQGSNVFTVPYLAALTDELGFSGNEERARHFLTETEAVQRGVVTLRPTDWLIADTTPYQQILSRRALALPSLPAGMQGEPTVAVGGGAAASAGITVPDGSVLLVRSHVRVPVKREEWVNYLGDVMAGCSTEDIQSACEVFTYLQSARPDA